MPEFEQRIDYTVDAMEDVRVQRAIAYEEDLLMDVYALPGDALRPVVFLVHGGPVPCEMPAPTTWAVFQSWAELLAA